MIVAHQGFKGLLQTLSCMDTGGPNASKVNRLCSDIRS